MIAGAPGCGKSHTLAAIALDAVASGRSVLLATQSVHAADVLAELLDRHPGPVPVQFGDTERRGALLARLGGSAGKGRDAREVRARRRPPTTPRRSSTASKPRSPPGSNSSGSAAAPTRSPPSCSATSRAWPRPISTGPNGSWPLPSATPAAGGPASVPAAAPSA
ncbi:hypothetical protein GCM10029992_20500 [Glycomyces albus]